ncbi:YeeE/YedE family protein (plasmid) [Deinococcus psychrotolerans]|uniref:YeeE/YedE family protein n=2 Tax=Deinococcus psychrotolerans TaxID=2489213 RepID=A0A3G8YLH4_9DEIO|nr:YeeE/YedE family protein [Deinococcus psychrotolerans]
MFHFQSFHMYGLIGSAVLTGMLTTGLLRHFRARSLDGQAIKIQHKAPGLPRYVFGGLTFGLGWGLAGVCPGPIFTLLGSGIWAMLIVLLFALIGTWLYGVLRNRLPH